MSKQVLAKIQYRFYKNAKFYADLSDFKSVDRNVKLFTQKYL